MRGVRQTKDYRAAILNRGFARSPVDALIAIKGGCRLCCKIPVRLDFDTDVVQDFSDLYARGDEDGEPHLPTACWP